MVDDDEGAAADEEEKEPVEAVNGGRPLLAGLDGDEDDGEETIAMQLQRQQNGGADGDESEDSDYSDLDLDMPQGLAADEVAMSADQLKELEPIAAATRANIKKALGANRALATDMTEAEATAAEGALDEAAKKKKKKNKKNKKQAADEHAKPGRGVIYLGHIPYGFFEDQMKGFFSQFGTITRLRLARNKKTGNSRHHAFLEFQDEEVAKIVAQTMHGYMMFDRTLVCQYVSAERVHAGTFPVSAHKFRVIPWGKVARERHNKIRKPEEQKKRLTRLIRKEEKKRIQLQQMGIHYDFPGYKADLKPVEATA
jgi:nucleolar protein 15